ncbi:hypothetical protein PG996_000813 [Apiospora saccharicola]|uniref:Uncharacterized protein n=1 Tax=Apiospora saccharicola TaxID=335842 RepID=A0ABR1WEZ3_9PEZI
MSSFIRRIISMRDVDDQRKKPISSSKKYALAPPATLYDDSDSDADDADDEYEADDEYSMSWETTKTGTSIHDIVVFIESSAAEENDVPVMRLNLDSQPDTTMIGEAIPSTEDNHIDDKHSSPVLEQSISICEGEVALAQKDEKSGSSDADDWEIVSADCCDSWAFELEVAEEDRVAREEEKLTVAKLRDSSRQETHIPPRSAAIKRHSGRKVAFTLKPDIFAE